MVLSLVAPAKLFYMQDGQNLLPRKSNARRRHQTIPGNIFGAASSNRRSLALPLHTYVYIIMDSVNNSWLTGEDPGSQATDDTNGIRRVSSFNVIVTFHIFTQHRI